MTVEDGAKLVISAGLVVPEYQDKLAGLAGEARADANADAKADNVADDRNAA